jgi:hypothetical protein
MMNKLGLTAREAADIVDPELAKELAKKRRVDARRDAEARSTPPPEKKT